MSALRMLPMKAERDGNEAPAGFVIDLRESESDERRFVVSPANITRRQADDGG